MPGEDPSEQPGHITGIGGVFFRARDRHRLLGLVPRRAGPPGHRLGHGQDGHHRLGGVRPGDGLLRPDPRQPYMVNYRVDDLDAALLRLRRRGCRRRRGDRRGRLRPVRVGRRPRGQPLRALGAGARAGSDQIRSGSTSIRRRPGGPGDRAPGHRTASSWSAARTHQRPSAASTTSSPVRDPQGLDEGGRRRAGDLRHRAERREAQELAPLPLRLGHGAHVRVHGRLHHLVVGRAGLEQEVAGRPARRPAPTPRRRGPLGPRAPAPARRPR